MRLFVLLASTSLLAACGGGGAQTVSSTPPPATGSGGSGTDNTVHTFADPKEAKTYSGIGSNHVADYLTDARECCDQQGITYSGNSTTQRDSSISIAYDPADAVYTLTVEDQLTGADAQTRFQDPPAGPISAARRSRSGARRSLPTRTIAIFRPATAIRVHPMIGRATGSSAPVTTTRRLTASRAAPIRPPACS